MSNDNTIITNNNNTNINNKILMFAMGALGLGIAAYFLRRKLQQQQQQVINQYEETVALLGDVGGTNIRLQLVTVKPPHNHPDKVIFKKTYLVEPYHSLETAIRQFLQQSPQQPQVAVIAIAGPIDDNHVEMANVPKWFRMSGYEIGQKLKIKTFQFINDFQANSYGLLVVPQDKFVTINKIPMQTDKICGVMGPGTGLGNSILFTTPFRKRKRVYVLPSEGGHTDFPYIDDEVVDFINFLKRKMNLSYISFQRSFCGPAIPYMFHYFKQRYVQDSLSDLQDVTSQLIIQKCLQQKDSPVFSNVLRLFLKIYSAGIGNFMSHHMCVGGLYLVGSLTNCLENELTSIQLLKEWKKRHPQIENTIAKIPIVLCKEIDLGLKGAFVVARRIIADQQHE